MASRTRTAEPSGANRSGKGGKDFVANLLMLSEAELMRPNG